MENATHMMMTGPISFSGQPLKVRIDEPAYGKTKAVIVVIHGMAEHHGRYQEFTDRLVAERYAVVRFDLPGHGQAALDKKVLGHFADWGGAETVLADLREVLRLLSLRYPDTPRVLFGHSMGSLLARRLMETNTYGFDVCILSGTMGKNPMFGFGRMVARLIARLYGPQHHSPLLVSMLNANLGKDRQENAWLTRDQDVVDEYNDNPLCGFPLTASAIGDMLSWAAHASSDKGIEGLCKHGKYLVISGEDDPVGNYGKGVTWLVDMMKNSNLDVSFHLYEEARHEILNELNREDVYADLISFLYDVLATGGIDGHN